MPKSIDPKDGALIIDENIESGGTLAILVLKLTRLGFRTEDIWFIPGMAYKNGYPYKFAHPLDKAEVFLEFVKP